MSDQEFHASGDPGEDSLEELLDDEEDDEADDVD